MAAKIETRNHGDGKIDVKIGERTVDVSSLAEAEAVIAGARLAYRLGRADEAAIRAAALNGLLAGNPLA